MRRTTLRWLALAVTLAVGAISGIADVRDPSSATAAAPAFNAFGTVRCTMAGTHSAKPGAIDTFTPGAVQLYTATLTCTPGTTGHRAVTVTSGRLMATSAAPTLSCASSPLIPVKAVITWTATGGKVNPTSVTWPGRTSTTNPRGAPVMTGSYSRRSALTFVVSSTPGQAACSSDPGMRSFTASAGQSGHEVRRPERPGMASAGRSGGNGVSTVDIPNTPTSPVQLFADDFEGGSLDRSKWRPNWLDATDAAVSPPVNTEEEGCYDPAQVSVASGYLHLRAVARSCTATNGITYPYASGLVQTRDHFTFTYGRLEARLWVPPSGGAIQNWPAFWANGTGVHPTTGELDVLEGLAGRPCWAFHSSSGDPAGCASPPNPAGWHVYAAEWRPGSVTYFYDGTPVGRLTEGITSSPMYLVLNLALSSTVSGPVTLPSEMLVDYVRVTG